MTRHERSLRSTNSGAGVPRTAAGVPTLIGTALSGAELMTAHKARIQLSGPAGNDFFAEAPTAHTSRADPGNTDDEDHIHRGEN